MKLFYRKYGNGPPLVILHGLYGSSDNWVTIAKKLSDSYTVYLPDQRNHGQSPHSEIHDYDSMRDDLFELVNQLAIKRFFLAGHSMGGKTAISFALKWPEMLNGLLIVDISPCSYENAINDSNLQHLTILNAILSIDLSKTISRGAVDSILKDKIPDDRIRGLILKNLQRTEYNTFEWRLNASVLLKNLDKIMQGISRETDYSQHISGFPVIFLKGGDSDYIKNSDFRDIRNLFPAVEIVEIPGAGHWVQVDKPDEVTENLKKLRGDY
jgi:esterase